MKRAGLRLLTRARAASAHTVLLAFVVCLVATGAATRPGTANAAVARGICVPGIAAMDPGTQATTLNEVGSPSLLHASYVRFLLSWAQAEPADVPPGQVPVLDLSAGSYMAGIVSAVGTAKADGLKVIITFYGVPTWASDSTKWKYSSGVYHPSGAMSTTCLPDFEAFCKAVATQLRGDVYAYECWNEPNGALFLSPQIIPGDSYFAADLYFQMFKSFRTGILAGAGEAAGRPLIVAGATAPTGHNNASSTTPQRFAARLKADGLGSKVPFDAYSHHPYMPGASLHQGPEAAPTYPDKTVTLENLGTLLKIFPTKSFLLTEYGVQTAPCAAFSGQYVNEITQADYLRCAYAYVARYPQVKLLMWYLLDDTRPAPPAPAVNGFYTGLDTATGAHKRAWYVFAGHNHLTITAPASVKLGTTIRLAGTLTCLVSSSGKPLVLQSHTVGKPWATGRTITTNASGGFSLTGVRPKATTYYRVSWQGVVTSSAVCVRVR